MLLLCIFHNFLSAFLSDFFYFLLCVFLFLCVHYEKNGSGPAGRGDCGGDEICVVRRRPQVFIKRKLNPSGQKKEKGANEFSGVHIY